jgi:DNA-binding transcriptional ArsR family regulator
MDADQDKVFKALADGGRRLLLDRLREENGQTLGRLCAHLAMSRQAATKHLAVLEEANLVVVVRRGREKLHYLNPVPIHDIALQWIGRFERGRLDALADLKDHLEGGPDG